MRNRDEIGQIVGQIPIDTISEPEGQEAPRLDMDRGQAGRHFRGNEPQLTRAPTRAVRPVPLTPQQNRQQAEPTLQERLEAAGTHGGRDKGPFGRLALDPRKLADVGQLGVYTATHPLEALERAGGFVGSAVKGWAERPQRAAAEYEPGVEDPEAGKKVAKEAFLSGPGTMATVGTARAMTQGARAAEVGASGADTFGRSYVRKAAEKIRAEERAKGLSEAEVRKRTAARLNEQFAGELDEGSSIGEHMIRNLPEPPVKGTPRAEINLQSTTRNAFMRARDDVTNAVDKVYRAQSNYNATSPNARGSAADRLREAERHLEAYKRNYERAIETIVNQQGLSQRFTGPNRFRDMEAHVNRLIPRNAPMDRLGTRPRKPSDEGGELGVGGGRPPRPPFKVVESTVPELRDTIMKSRKMMDEAEEMIAYAKELRQKHLNNPRIRPDQIERLDAAIAQSESDLAIQKKIHDHSVLMAGKLANIKGTFEEIEAKIGEMREFIKPTKPPEGGGELEAGGIPAFDVGDEYDDEEPVGDQPDVSPEYKDMITPKGPPDESGEGLEVNAMGGGLPKPAEGEQPSLTSDDVAEIASGLGLVPQEAKPGDALTEDYRDDEGALHINITRTPTIPRDPVPEEAQVKARKRDEIGAPVSQKPSVRPRDKLGAPVGQAPGAVNRDAIGKAVEPGPPKRDQVGKPVELTDKDRMMMELTAPIGIYTETVRKNALALGQSVNELFQSRTVGGAAWHGLEVIGSSFGFAFSPAEAAIAWAVGRPFETATGLEGSRKKIGEYGSMAVQIATDPVMLAGRAGAAVRGSRIGQEAIGAVAATQTNPVRIPAAGRTPARTLSPGQMGNIIVPWSAKLARATALASDAVDRFRGVINRLPEAQRFHFMDLWETGQIHLLPRELQAVAATLKSLLDERVANIQSLSARTGGPAYLQNPIQHYFPHIWEAPTPQIQAQIHALQQAIISGQSRRPIKGSGAFLRQRTIPLIEQGRRAGLRLVTSDPIELTLIKLREMDKFYFGTLMAQEIKESGVARFTRNGHRVPVGWVKLLDPAFEGRRQVTPAGGGPRVWVTTGHWYAPSPVARVFNNYTSQGIVGRSAIYDTLRAGANGMNSLQLGLSGYHVIFTSLDVLTSTAALGLQQLQRGEILRGSMNLARSMTPILGILTESIPNVVRGERLRSAYFNHVAATPAMARMVSAMEQAGGRANMDAFFRIGRTGGLVKGLRNGQITRMIADEFRNHPYRAVLKAPFHLAGAALNDLAWPIMEYIVPRQKLGVFYMLAEDLMRRNPGMTTAQMRHELQSIWTSVDNRLGQMVYDNLFWNKVFKDASFLAVRSVGWNLGTIRELGGGVADFGAYVRNLSAGQRAEFTHRMAYTTMLPIITAVYGGTFTYLMTRRAPEGIDYIAPPTGTFTPAGQPERFLIPSYLKDVLEYHRHPAQTVTNKLNPLWGALGELFVSNRDFYGALIRNPDDPAAQQIKDLGDYLLELGKPFSMRSAQRLERQGASPLVTWASYLGLQAAPGYITNPERGEQYTRRQEQRAARVKQKRQGQ